jgi:hypothetical protein
MISNTFTGITRLVAPTLAAIRRRAAELLDIQEQLEPQPQLETRPAPPTLPPAPTSSEPKLGEAALSGVAGLAVCALAPHTGAHPRRNSSPASGRHRDGAGPGPHCMVDATRHGLNLFVVLIGESSKARKGTSWNQIRRLFSEVDHPWVTERVTTARLKPAALTYDLRDEQPATDRRLSGFRKNSPPFSTTWGEPKVLSRPCSAATGIVAISVRSMVAARSRQAGRISASSPTSRNANSHSISTPQRRTTALPPLPLDWGAAQPMPDGRRQHGLT